MNELAVPDLDETLAVAEQLVKSNFFTDASTATKAAVKILAGRELGLGPVESMRSFHIVENKIEFAAEFLAQRVRLHAHYDYRVVTLDNFACELSFLEDGVELGRSRFDDQDRQAAGFETEGVNGKGEVYVTTWGKYPRNMLFARAMSNGVAWFCPDVVASQIVDGIGFLAPDPDPSASSTVDSGSTVAAGSFEDALPSVLAAERVGEEGSHSAGAASLVAHPVGTDATSPTDTPSPAYGEGADGGEESGGDETSVEVSDPPPSEHDHIWIDSPKLAKHEVCTIEGCFEVRRKPKTTVHTAPPDERKDLAS